MHASHYTFKQSNLSQKLWAENIYYSIETEGVSENVERCIYSSQKFKFNLTFEIIWNNCWPIIGPDWSYAAACSFRPPSLGSDEREVMRMSHDKFPPNYSWLPKLTVSYMYHRTFPKNVISQNILDNSPFMGPNLKQHQIIYQQLLMFALFSL